MANGDIDTTGLGAEIDTPAPMDPSELRALRLAVAPDLSLNAFGRALGYRDPTSYRRMEKGHRPISPRLAATARALERTGLPRDWAEAARAGTVNPIGVACAALHIERLAREAG